MNTNEPMRYHEHSIVSLIKTALSNDCAEDTFQQILWQLCLTTTAEVFESAQQLSQDTDPARRELGVLILGQFGMSAPVREMQVVRILLDILEKEENLDVISSIGWGLGHRRAPEGVAPLAKLKCHPSSQIRLAVAGGLQYQSSNLAIETLIELSQDVDAEVRGLATFILGSQITEDSKAIREALSARLADSDLKTRREAVHGLALRKDQRAAIPLLEFLTASQVIFEDIQAAYRLANPDLLAALFALKGCEKVSESEIDDAIDRCNKDLEQFHKTVSYEGYQPHFDFEYFIGLLGKPATEETISQIIEKLDEAPKNTFGNIASEKIYFASILDQMQVFRDSGLSIFIENARFSTITFHLHHTVTSTNGMRTYTGTLPHGITRHDSIADIAQKLGLEPQHRGLFVFPDYFFLFDYDEVSDQLISFGISELPRDTSQ